MSDTYSLFSEATERNLFDFDDEIMQSPAYRKVYSSVRDAKHLQRTRHRPSAMVANLLDDDDLIQLDDHPPLAATYTKELQKEMLVGQTVESLPGSSVTGERSPSTYEVSEVAGFEVGDVRTSITSQSSQKISSEDLHAVTGTHLLAPSLVNVHECTTEHLNPDRTEDLNVQSPVMESIQLETDRVAQLVQERRKDPNTSELSSQLDEATAPPEDVAPEGKNFSPTCRTLNLIHPEHKATKLSDDPLVTASALGFDDSVRSTLLQVKVVDTGAIDIAFFYAACNGHTKVIEMLLQRSADVNFQDHGTVQFCGGLHMDLSSLHFAAANNQGSMIELLLDNGADINIKDGSSWTPLHVAAARGCTSAVEVLLQRGAVLEARTCLTDVEKKLTKRPWERSVDKCTALCLAVFFGFPDTVRVLLANGANKDLKVGPGITSLHVAVLGGLSTHAAMFCNGRLSPPGCRCMVLGRSIIQPAENPCEYESRSPALRASDRVQLLELLVQNGCDPQQSDDFGFTPLHFACLQDSLDVFESLLKITSNVSTVSRTGWTPLHLGALSSHDTKAKAILDAGGALEASHTIEVTHNPNDIYFKDVTPLKLAIMLQHHTVTRFFLQRGASKEMSGSGVNILHLVALYGSSPTLVMLAKQGIGWQRKLTNLDVHIPPEMSDEEWLPLSLRIDINAAYRTGMTPLLQYIMDRWRKNLTVVQVMLDLKADVKARDRSGQSVLHSSNLDLERATLLIDAGADLEARDSLGHTPLLGAVHHSYIELSGLLIILGADIYAKDDLGRSAWKILSDRHTPARIARATLRLSSSGLIRSTREIKRMLDDAKKTRQPPRGWKE